jgi:tRNA pseudouridine38-40 synthase
MPRYKIIVEYDGGPFVGWQRQQSGPSIQAALEDAVFALCGERVMVHGAGRTDAGVHALGQIAHFDIAATKRPEEVRGALTFHLKPLPIVVLQATIVSADFHARFSAVWRRYRYRILNRRTPAALEHGHVWHVPVPLDTTAMQAAASVLIGNHDFNSFRSVNCQARSSIKTLDCLTVSPVGDEIAIDVGARSFLHNQVRILVGTLALVGRGAWRQADVEQALAARDRTRAGPTAPPHGLYLMEVRYDRSQGWEAHPEEAADDE